MKNNAEIKKIINLLSEKKITAEQAERLLNALDKTAEKPKISPKKLHLVITEEDAEKPKLKLAIPLVLAKIGTKFIPKNIQLNASLNGSDFDFNSIDWVEIIRLAESGETGDLFYFEADDNGKNVIIRIYVD